MDVVGMNPEESGRFFAQEAALWGKIVREAKISLD
jgi:hypothetical protein